MFLVVHDPINTSQKLNDNLHTVSLWTYKWKMSFNPDPSKQAQEVIFLRKINKVHLPPFLFNNLPFNKYHLKNIYGYILMKSLNSNIILMKR